MNEFDESMFCKAKIVYLLTYGAIIEVDGIEGVLKNRDFSTDYTAVSDLYKVGDEIDVRYVKTTKNGKRIFEAKDRVHTSSLHSIEDFHVGDEVLGGITSSRKDFSFVAIGDGVEALTYSTYGRYNDGDKVILRITRIDNECTNLKKNGIRGRILRKAE